ncbi:MAG: ATP-binding protein [Cyclonatronaceae bacterium]
MHLTKKQVEKARNVYDLYWDSYQKGDVDTFASTLHDNYEMIGTSESEICHNKAKGIEFFKGQAEEVVGKAEMRNRQINAMPVGDLVLINEMCDIFVLAGTGWAFYSKIRISTFLQETPSGWKVVQQHGSLPDMRVQEGETLAIDKISRENVELRDAVKRRTVELEVKNRELEIEAALERVRARAMAMHKSNELNEVVSVLFEKLKELQIPFTAVGIATGIEGSKDLNAFVCGHNEAGLVITNYRLPYFDNPIPKDLYGALEKQLDFYVGHYSKEEKDAFYEYVIEHTAEFRHLPEDIKRMIFESPTYTISMVAVKNAVFNINDFEGKILAEHEVDIIKRFANVFDQAYTRFLDLQKAEAQTREAQIEAALERVRSRTMAMQSSDELGAVAAELFAQMNQLVTNLWTCGFVLCEKDRNEDEWWLSMDGDFTRGFFLPNIGDYAHATLYEGWLKGHESSAVQLEGDSLQQHYDWLMDIPVSRAIFEEMDAAGLARPDWQKLHAAYFSKGYLVLITREPCSDEYIFNRFAQVFDLTFTRFLDLQKAEAQAREAQIELSMQRIRAQVTAMQESSELLDIVVTMRTEFVNLGHEAHYFWHMRWLPEHYKKAMTSGDGTRIGMVMTLPRHIHGDIEPVAEWEKSGEPTYILAMDVDTAVEYVHKMITLGDFEQVDPQAPSLDDIRHIGGLTFVMARTTHGEIGYSLPGVVPDPPKDAVDTLVRFAGVFDLAYKRFEDLKYAERQHREAQIELALERVRARTMAMQHSDELADASRVLDEQVRALGIETWGCAFHIYADNADGDYEWFSSANGNLPFYKTPRENFFLRFYEKGQRGETFHIEEFAGDGCKAHYDFLKTLPVAGDALKALEESGIPLPDYQIDHIAFFSHGYILFITYEHVPEAHEIFHRFARVFEQTYTRFIDLQKLEEQALRAEKDLIAIKAARHKAEEALTELKATQEQLVQQEKLASLGQLTAGIAHEIKNPLNFVNNFSDVSLEMIDEALEELGKSSQDDHTSETAAILADIKSNLSKIHEHGSRADSIVKAMLMHSRGGDGKMEPVNLNELVKEYVNLSYHGMRAGKDPIEVDIDLHLDESIGEVPLIAEDFSRVILNLCTNAFDACAQRGSFESLPQSGSPRRVPPYTPRITIRTGKTNGTITIDIEDNGPGIPDDIKDKILQPFFTTKKGTQGTGLGLSITNDIIKAHGGRMDVKSTPGVKTTFTIYLEKSL